MGDAVGGIIGGVGSIVGGAMGSDASSSAARAQQRAAEQANELQRELYEKNTANLQPYMNAGNSGLQALLYRMGLGGSANGAAPFQEQTEAQIRESLLPQFTTRGSGSPSDFRFAQSAYQGEKPGFDWTYVDGQGWGYMPNGGSSGGGIDEAGLQAAVRSRMAEQADAANRAKNDPLYGSLLSIYKEYKPFSMADFQVDPGYQFRLDQGNKALQNMAAMTGNLNSGRALKDAIGYNSGMGSQEYANAYGRYNNDYLTGFNTHNTNQTNTFNKLASLAGMGQSSASSLAGVSQNYGAQVGNNLAQAANAQAAGTIGSNNAWAQGISGLGNALGGMMSNRSSGYSGSFQPTAGVGGLSSGQGVNGWW